MTSPITKLREAVEACLARLGWWLVNRYDPIDDDPYSEAYGEHAGGPR